MCVCVCVYNYIHIYIYICKYQILMICDPWTIACQSPLSMGFFRQEYWSGLPFPPPGDHPNPSTEPPTPALQAVSALSEPPGKPSFNNA